MNSIRVNTYTKKIEVNDEGEYIILPLGDHGFITRFMNYEKKLGEVESQIAAINEENAMESYVQISKKMTDDLEELLGEGTCKKVFGEIQPTFDLIFDFTSQLSPLIEKFMNERYSDIDKKYSAERLGNV